MNAARFSRSLQCLQRRRWLVMSLFILMISFSIANKSGSEKLRPIILLRMSYFSPNIFERLLSETHGKCSIFSSSKKSPNCGTNCVMPGRWIGSPWALIKSLRRVEDMLTTRATQAESSRSSTEMLPATCAIHHRKHDQVNHTKEEYARYERGVCISTNTVEGFFPTQAWNKRHISPRQRTALAPLPVRV